MLMPKRVKRRKQHRGRMKGIATKGNAVAYGSYGLMADGRGWIDSNQIEAARVAMTRSIKRGGKVYTLRSIPSSRASNGIWDGLESKNPTHLTPCGTISPSAA